MTSATDRPTKAFCQTMEEAGGLPLMGGVSSRVCRRQITRGPVFSTRCAYIYLLFFMRFENVIEQRNSKLQGYYSKLVL